MGSLIANEIIKEGKIKHTSKLNSISYIGIYYKFELTGLIYTIFG